MTTHLSLFEQLTERVEAWLVRLDRERDLALRQVLREGHKPHLEAWMDRLDIERTKHLDLIRRLEALRRANHPALLLPVRPVKATMKQDRPRKRA